MAEIKQGLPSMTETEMNPSKTKYDKLFAAYEAFTAATADVNDPTVSVLRSAWNSAKNAYQEMLESGVRKSQIASGMEQGLREMPMMLSTVEAGKRAEVLKILHRAVATHCPEFFKQDASLLAAIIERSKIRSAREYYLVRHRIDEIEGDASAADECSLLYRLVDRFEA